MLVNTASDGKARFKRLSGWAKLLDVLSEGTVEVTVSPVASVPVPPVTPVKLVAVLPV